VVYEGWVTSQWKGLEAELSAGRKPEDTARRLVELSIEFHTKWRGLRASLGELVFTDAEVRQFYRSQRRRQLDVIVGLRRRLGIPAGRREDDAIRYLTMLQNKVIAPLAIELRSLGRLHIEGPRLHEIALISKQL
jgi:hypothetical protein